MLHDKIRKFIQSSVLCWLATVDDEGQPNVSPKEMFCAHGDDKILIADIASPNSVRNMMSQPKVCVSFVDVFRQLGFKLYGTAEIIGRDTPEFSAIGSEILAMAGEDFKVRRLIVVTITRAKPIIAPGYNLSPPRTEEQQTRNGYATYGVRPD